jgi:hypothetical protein
MTLRPDIVEFVNALEVFCKRRLNYPLEVGEILQTALQTGLTTEFEELIFQAKFLVRTQDVLSHISRETQGFEKLAAEFQSSVTKSMDLLKMLAGRSEPDVAQKYSDIFFAVEADSFARLMKFYVDLSWVKNWQIDGKALPYETTSSTKSQSPDQAVVRSGENQQNNQFIKSLARIQKIAVLAAILVVLFLLIDPPVSILGWVLSLWIAVLLVYIVLQAIVLTRIKNSQ